MSLKSICPMIATDRLPQTRAFYDWLGFKVVCADPRGLQFAWPEDRDLRIGFASPDDPGRPGVLRGRFDGAGLTLRLDVEDIETLYRRIGAVHTLALKLRDGPCGRPHFAIVDPNGVVLEFVGPLAASASERKSGAGSTLPALPAPAPSSVAYPRVFLEEVMG